MNRWQRFVVMALAVLACCSDAFGHDGGYRNAAKHYQRAFERFEGLSYDDRSLLLNVDLASTPPTQAIRDAMRRAQPILNDFHRASLQPYSDFHLDYSQGFDLVIPHLANMRDVVRLAKTDIQLRLADGDSAGAADRLAAMGRNLQHYNDDRLLISSLVGGAVYALVDDTIQLGLDAAAFDPAEALKILQPLEQLNATADPFGYLESIATEQDLIVMAMTDAFKNDSMSETLDSLWGPDHVDDPFRERWETLPEHEFELHVEAYDQFLDDVAEVFAMDDPELAAERMAELSDTFVNSEHNLFASVIISYNHVLRSKHNSEGLLRDRINDLRAIVAGEVDAHAIANAAVWYLRGLDMLNDLDEDAITLLREDHLWDTPLPDDLANVLRDEAQPIINEFRTGSEIRQCDFSIARSHEHPFIPRYTPGMRDAFRLLHADAIDAMHRNDAEALADRLAISYRIIAHLGGDAQLPSCLVSHTAFEHTHLLVEAALEAEHLSLAHMEELNAAFDRISRADPFGYAAAIRMTRRDLSNAAERLARDFEVDLEAPHFDELSQNLRNGDPDRLLTLLALNDAYLQHREDDLFKAGYFPADLKMPTVKIEPLADVVELDEVNALRERAREVVAAVISGTSTDAERHYLTEPTNVTDITTRMQRARSVLRIGAAMFHVTVTPDDPPGVDR